MLQKSYEFHHDSLVMKTSKKEIQFRLSGPWKNLNSEERCEYVMELSHLRNTRRAPHTESHGIFTSTCHFSTPYLQNTCVLAFCFFIFANQTRFSCFFSAAKILGCMRSEG